MKLCRNLSKSMLLLSAALLISPYLLADEHETAKCPAQFYQLPLYPEARLCMIFDDSLPASLTYHANATTGETQAFYQQHFGSNASWTEQKGRIKVVSADNNQTIIISVDGAGTQVDILVKGDS